MAGDYLHGIKTLFMDQNQDPIELLDASIGFMIGTGIGADESIFPVGKSVLVNSHAMIAKLGEGTLRRGMLDVFEQGPALVVVHRIEGDTDEEIKSQIIGMLDNDTGQMTGLNALLNCESEAGKRPRLVCVPEIQDLDIAQAMVSVCSKYNAIPIVEADGTGFASYSEFTKQLDGAYVIAGGAKFFDSEKSDDVVLGGSATAMGVIIRTDNEIGFQQAPSNKIANRIKGPGIPIDYTPGSGTCLANVYNSENMTVYASMKGGTKLWGQRLSNGKSIQKERVRLLIADTIREETQDIIDGNITAPFVDKLVERVQNFIDRMTLDLVISGGRVWVPKEINIASIGTNEFYLDYEVGYYDSAEKVTYRQYMNNEYTEKVFDR